MKSIEIDRTRMLRDQPATGHNRLHPDIAPMHLAAVNDKHGWKVLESFPNIPPTETMQLCDLIKNPNQHTQYQPK